jgi:hypothetical protein
MNLEWILLAEGFGTNANGAMTAIAINQNVVAAPVLPATTKRVIMAHFVGDDAESHALIGKDVTVSAQVLGPSGDVIFAATAGGKFPTPPWPDLPTGLDIAVELQLRIIEYGRYEVRVSAQAPGAPKMEGHTYVYARQPPVST